MRFRAFASGLLGTALLFGACGDDNPTGSGGGSTEERLVGLWLELHEGSEIRLTEFHEDGTYRMVYAWGDEALHCPGFECCHHWVIFDNHGFPNSIRMSYLEGSPLEPADETYQVSFEESNGAEFLIFKKPWDSGDMVYGRFVKQHETPPGMPSECP